MKNKKNYHISFITAHLYNYFFPENATEFGGVSRVFRIVKGLSKNKKFKITCFVGDFGQKHEINIQNITLINSPINQRNKVLSIFKLLFKTSPDLIIEFYASPMLFVLGLLKKLKGQKFLFFVGNDPDVDGGYRKRTNILFYYLYVWGLRQADCIICQTRSQVDKLKNHYELDSKFVLSPYIEETTPLKKKKEIILWVGRSAYQKQPGIFLDLAHCIANEKFVMICNKSDHDKGLHDKFKQRAEEIPNVEFIEKIPHPKIKKYFSMAKLLINTSQFEGFPNTFIEAAMEKTPIVSLSVDPDGMLTQYHTGICCDGSVANLALNCQKLLKDDGLRGTMGENVREYALTYHGLNNALRKINKIVLDILEKKTK